MGLQNIWRKGLQEGHYCIKGQRGSKAEKADMQPGDIISEINGENTADMLNVEAQNKIKNSKTQLQLVVERPDPPSSGQTNGTISPEQITGRFQEAVIVSRDENQNYREYTISSPASLSPGPYSPDPFGSSDGKRLTPTINKSVTLRPWSPDEKSHRLSRPLSQEFSPSDYRNNSVSSRTPTHQGATPPTAPSIGTFPCPLVAAVRALTLPCRSSTGTQRCTR
ncbi:hypothetical protein F7725_012536 [Dissostichus mawsoni]|uniref:PDZ domain-containing protein n=1 Tax=Dissostichus mawsoni TaxID=36200 RepID=A0A7J5YMK9_DISMA|nr:hypothetical protein F7725_012536 [Dissostichus mawsoni]